MKKEQIEKLREEMNNIIDENKDNFLEETQQTIEEVSDSKNTTEAIVTLITKMSSSIYINLSNQMTAMIDALLDGLENTEE
ncbi:hypothetical protein [Blautia intestinalis]|uniref:hypothetical protein n=1 Tax=Blautia intestinalis TaxID=2763028 RepID=UPI0022E30131|nr:hypothetical protein [Blautia intestinalis]